MHVMLSQSPFIPPIPPPPEDPEELSPVHVDCSLEKRYMVGASYPSSPDSAEWIEGCTPTTEVSSMETCATAEPVQVDDTFNFEMINLQIENTIFPVLKNGLNVAGTMFRRKFASADYSLRLYGVYPSEFRTFLKVLYPFLNKTGRPELEEEEWIAVLKLSTMWGFTEIRNRSIAVLEPSIESKSPLQKIYLGKQYKVVAWRKEGYQSLCEQKNLSLDDLPSALAVPGFLLGQEKLLQPQEALKIFAIRDQLARQMLSKMEQERQWQPSWLCDNPTANCRAGMVTCRCQVVALIDSVFEDELKDTEYSDFDDIRDVTTTEVQHGGDSITHPQIPVELLDTTTATLIPQDSEPSPAPSPTHDADMQDDCESVDSELTDPKLQVSTNITARINKVIYLKANIEMSQLRLRELKELGRDSDAVETNALGKKIRKLQRELEHRYSASMTITQRQGLGWTSRGGIVLHNMTLRGALQKVDEEMEALLSPTASHLKCTFIFSIKSRRTLATRVQFKLNMSYCLQNYTTYNNSTKSLEVWVPEEKFSQWLEELLAQPLEPDFGI